MGKPEFVYRAAPCGHRVLVRFRAGAGTLRHRPGGDAGGNCRLEHRYRPRRIEPAAGQRQRRARQAVFAEQCAACHGAEGQGGLGDRLVGGQGTLATPKPVRTVGSYWPYAPTLFDYIRRAMPQNAPQSLSNEDVYAVSAYILHLNGLVPADAVLDAKSLAAVRCRTATGSSPIRGRTFETAESADTRRFSEPSVAWRRTGTIRYERPPRYARQSRLRRV